MQGKALVFVDVETTGLAAWNSRMLEIGAIRVENGKVVGRYSQLLDPVEPVPPAITRLTGITNSHTYGKPKFADISPRLSALFENAVFIAHNVSFDYSFFREEYKRLGQQFAMDRLCTVRLSRALYPAERNHRLDEVIRRHGYQVANRHRAFDDAEVLYKFYRDHELHYGQQFYEIAGRLLQPVA